MKKTLSVVLALGIVFIPSIVAAAYVPGSYRFPSGSNDTFADIIFWVLDWMNLAIQGIIALAVLAFLWGVLQFVRKAEDQEARAQGRNFIIFGIIGLAVMLSFWGLVGFVLNTFNLNPQGSIIPQFNNTTNTTNNTFKAPSFAAPKDTRPNFSDLDGQTYKDTDGNNIPVINNTGVGI